MKKDTLPTFYLVGSPNCGKSTLFNILTGANQKISNFPGVTVEQKYGKILSPFGQAFILVDLPGIYSLSPQSRDEQLTVDLLIQAAGDQNRSKAVIIVIDASQLQRGLSLVLEIKRLNLPMLVVVNMMDLADRLGLMIDVNRMSEILGVPVVKAIGRRGVGTSDLLAAAQDVFATFPVNSENQIDVKTPEDRFSKVDEILASVLFAPDVQNDRGEVLDRFLLHPVFGGIFFVVIIFLMFQGVFSLAETPMFWIESGFSALAEASGSFMKDGFLKSLWLDGMLAGLSSVLMFLPQIVILFLFIFLLEGTGYMARGALILDRFMAMFGLPGRSFVPLLSSFACAIPGIMATRTMRDPKDRLVTMMVAPLITCSARLPVYVLLVGAFIPNRVVFGVVHLQGLVMMGLFAMAIFSVFFSAYAFKRLILGRSRSPLLLELPSYKWPDLKNVGLNVFLRGKAFVVKAGTIILGINIGLWILSSYPKAPDGDLGGDIEYSYVAKIGKSIQPIMEPIGFDWRITSAIIAGFGAREVVVAALATLLALEPTESDEGFSQLSRTISQEWSLATGCSLLMWYVFSPQCLATFATIRRETMGWKWSLVGFAYLLVLAYAFSWATFQFVQMW